MICIMQIATVHVLCPDARERAGPVFPPPMWPGAGGGGLQEETQAQRAHARRDKHVLAPTLLLSRYNSSSV